MAQNLYRVRTALSGWTGGPGLATYYFETVDPTGPGTVEDAQTALDGVHGAFSGLLNMFPAFMRINVSPTVDVIQDVTGALVESHVGTTPAEISGDAGGLSLPQATMLCINFLTLDIISGHRVRGRSFIGPLKANEDADGTPTSTQLTQMDEFGDDLFENELTQAIWHRPVSGAGGRSCPVTGHITSDRFAVLRSRRG
jgi:hypothetical protein